MLNATSFGKRRKISGPFGPWTHTHLDCYPGKPFCFCVGCASRMEGSSKRLFFGCLTACRILSSLQRKSLWPLISDFSVLGIMSLDSPTHNKEMLTIHSSSVLSGLSGMNVVEHRLCPLRHPRSLSSSATTHIYTPCQNAPRHLPPNFPRSVYD